MKRVIASRTYRGHSTFVLVSFVTVTIRWSSQGSPEEIAKIRLRKARGAVARRRRRSKANGQPGRATDVQCPSRFPRVIVGSLQFGASCEEVAQANPCLQPRQGGANAEVNAAAERQVWIGIPRDVEFVWADELCRIAIGGPDDGEHELARNQRVAAEL